MAKFEDNLASLETVVERLERGDLSLEESVKLFEEGVTLSSACKAELDAAEGRVQVLVEQGSGRQVAEDLDVDDEPDAAEEDEEE
jgi:exodeoxyribonuclease VII small subunit